ncbi:hypothetical protein [Amycolatopsis magusensis]|uniref:hypothetical protein n=1 Tax=Amycolatopsis magusensis TaxID=882444 RepID=UPI0037959580
MKEDTMFDLLLDLLHGRNAPSGDDDALPGAELVVLQGDTEVFRAALARHARRDTDEPAVIWIRPLAVPCRDPGTQLPVFDPDIVRRRALHVTSVAADDGQLMLDLATGERAIIQSATAEQLAVLQDWDTWMATLPETDQADLDALDHD